MADAGVIIAIAVVVLVCYTIYSGFQVVAEKEVMVIERLGKFKEELSAGLHFIVPFIDQPKKYNMRYFVTTAMGNTELVSKVGKTKVMMQNEVLDFPKQSVISRDNAMISLDAVLNYRVTSARTMLYNCQNLPQMLSKLLQAQIRNVAGALDVDQLIEDTAAMDRVSGEIAPQARRWGVQIEFVKVQRVVAGALTDVLAKRKNADLKNQEVIINAKASKQTQIIEAEGHRDRMVREAEGEAQQQLSRARGQAQAVLNVARAESRTVKEVARAIARTGENPTRYLLALKYIEAMKAIVALPNTTVHMMPKETAYLQTAVELGINTVHPPRKTA